MAKTERRAIDKVLIFFGGVTVLVFLALGGLTWWAYHFADTTVTAELSAQKIYFPTLGSPELASPQIGPYLNQYAGKQLLTGPEAKAYADHFIDVHLSEVAGGQTYAQVSSASLANPSNTQLKTEAQTLFQGETLRGLLLGDGYAYWTFGNIARYAAIVAFAGAAVMAVLVVTGLGHLRRLK